MASAALESIATRIITTFGDRETEQNWEKIDTLYKEFIGELVNDHYSNADVINAVKRFKEVLYSTVTTLLI